MSMKKSIFENGKTKVNAKTFTEFQNNIEEAISLVDQKIEGEGWQDLTLTSDFHAYRDISSKAPKYRKTGKLVEIIGEIAPTSNISAGENKIITTLPEGFRPSVDRYFICQGSGRAIWTLYVYTDGRVIFSRYGKSEYTEAPTSVWLPFSVMFLVD